MHESWRHGAHSFSEAAAGDVAADGCGSKELRVIEDVEGFNTKLQRMIPFRHKVPRERRVKTIRAGAGEEAATRVALRSKSGQREPARAEDGRAAAWICKQLPLFINRVNPTHLLQHW